MFSVVLQFTFYHKKCIVILVIFQTGESAMKDVKDSKMTRKMQAAQTRRTILATLKEMLQEKPITQIRITELCKNAGIALGTFYTYFKDKDDALLKLHAETSDLTTEMILTGTPEDNLRDVIQHYYNSTVSLDTERVRNLYASHLMHYDPFFFSDSFPLTQSISKEISSIIEDNDKAHAITKMIMNYVRGNIYTLCISFGKPTERWVADTTDLTMAYFHFLSESWEKLPKFEELEKIGYTEGQR